MLCFNVKITQTQINNGQKDVMEFSGSMQIIEVHNKKYYNLSLDGNIPYLMIHDIDEETLELCFMATNNMLLLKKDKQVIYEHKEQGAKLDLNILLIKKKITDTKIVLKYQILEQVLLAENTLEIEVK